MHLFQAIALEGLKDAPLIRLANAIDWEPVARILDDEVKRVRQRKGGREPYNPAAMFRALLLGEWFGLSYQKLAHALRVRLDFILFCGFDAIDDLPDATTINRFALRIAKQGVYIKAKCIVSTEISRLGMALFPTHGALQDISIRFGSYKRWLTNDNA